MSSAGEGKQAEAMFDEKALKWDDMPIIAGMKELVKSWIVSKPWWTPPLDGPALDFGCGTGNITMALREDLGEKVTGVDTSKGMLDQFEAKAVGKGVTTFPVELKGPGQLGDGADGSFALIFSCLVLHHIKDCEGTVSALTGYLRPGGRMLLFDFEATENATLFHPSDFEIGNQLEHHGIAEADLRAWCEKTGKLENIQIERVPFRKEPGVQGAFNSEAGDQFQLLALSCTKKTV